MAKKEKGDPKIALDTQGEGIIVLRRPLGKLWFDFDGQVSFREVTQTI